MTEETKTNELLNVDQVAEMAGLSATRIRQLIGEGEIEAHDYGRNQGPGKTKYGIEESEAKAFVDRYDLSKSARGFASPKHPLYNQPNRNPPKVIRIKLGGSVQEGLKIRDNLTPEEIFLILKKAIDLKQSGQSVQSIIARLD